MILVSLSNVKKEYDSRMLLDGVDLGINYGDKIGVIGRNGCGKSTLLKMIAGIDHPDSGEIHARNGVSVGYLEQFTSLDSNKTIIEEARLAFGETGALILRHEQVSMQLETETGDLTGLLDEQAALHEQIDRNDGWEIDYKVAAILEELGLQDKPVKNLSGGEKKRFEIARLFFTRPDIMLLDEPTNHLDTATIELLEKMIARYQGAVVIITHDRYFLDSIVNFIVEIDRGALSRFNGGYGDYLREKHLLLQNEKVVEAKFRKLVAKEEAWLRKGVRARRTRNEGRVRNLKQLRHAAAGIKGAEGSMVIESSISRRPSKKVLETKKISKSFDGKVLFKNLNITLRAGERLALVGPNGCGKTTLLKILMEEMAPDSGYVKWGMNAEFAYYRQDRVFYDPESTILNEVGKGRSFIEVADRSKHIYSYMQNFLFSPEQLQGPIKHLSGGEKNKVALATLFLEKANLLILDEPTNDLDIASLQVLEDALVDYKGSIVMVSHDRFLVDKTATRSLFFDGTGQVHDVIGGYTALLDYVKRLEDEQKAVARAEKTVKKKQLKKEPAQQKRSYKEEKEFSGIESDISRIEVELETLKTQLDTGNLYQENPALFNEIMSGLESRQKELEKLYDRWAELG